MDLWLAAVHGSSAKAVQGAAPFAKVSTSQVAREPPQNDAQLPTSNTYTDRCTSRLDNQPLDALCCERDLWRGCEESASAQLCRRCNVVPALIW